MKTVNIQIALNDWKTLRASKYKLCFAKMVNNTFNVIWRSFDTYLESNTFQWTPAYQLFGTNTFEDKSIVRVVTTNKVNIRLGEGSMLNKDGYLEPPTTQGPSTAMTLINEYGLIHPGLNQLSTGIDGTQMSTPMYVAREPIVLGTDELAPVDQIQVWFEQDVEPGTMFSFDQGVESDTMVGMARSKAVILDLRNSDTATALYQNGTWSYQPNAT